MSIISWNKSVKYVPSQDEDGEDLLYHLLKTDPKSSLINWHGCISKSRYSQLERVEIRTNLSCGVDLLIIVGDTEEMHCRPGFGRTSFVRTDQNIQISANGKIRLTNDEFKELATVILEAQAVERGLNGKQNDKDS